MVALANTGQFGGVRGIIKPSGKYFIPPHLTYVGDSTTTAATTGARYYVVPWYFDRPTTLAGAWCYNGGVGDNGDKAKMALYSEAAAGGPGALVKNFGEITFTGAIALRTFASSVSITPGMYYLEFVTDNAVTMCLMASSIYQTAAGAFVPNVLSNMNGSYGVTLDTVGPRSIPAADYVAGTYANFPESTSLTPTATLYGATVPLFGVYA